MSSRISLTERLAAWKLASDVVPKVRGFKSPDRLADRRKRIRRKVKALLASL